MKRVLLFLGVLVAVTACDPAIDSRREPSPLPPRAAPAAAPLVAAGEATTVSPDTANANLQWAASVVQLDQLPGQDAHLFGTAGGDPAMNGLQTWIAFYLDPADGWRIFPIGDVLAYRVLRSEKGRVDLEIRESTMDQASGVIGERTRRVIVAWTRGPDDTAPAQVSVTPAR